jgi:hypothetical protein
MTESLHKLIPRSEFEPVKAEIFQSIDSIPKTEYENHSVAYQSDLEDKSYILRLNEHLMSGLQLLQLIPIREGRHYERGDGVHLYGKAETMLSRIFRRFAGVIDIAPKDNTRASTKLVYDSRRHDKGNIIFAKYQAGAISDPYCFAEVVKNIDFSKPLGVVDGLSYEDRQQYEKAHAELISRAYWKITRAKLPKVVGPGIIDLESLGKKKSLGSDQVHVNFYTYNQNAGEVLMSRHFLDTNGKLVSELYSNNQVPHSNYMSLVYRVDANSSGVDNLSDGGVKPMTDETVQYFLWALDTY